MDNRNCLYISVPLNATQEEIESAHTAIDRLTNNVAVAAAIAPAQVAAAQQAAPAQVAAAPAATTEQAATLDAKNFPWDERIHSSNKQFNKDGTWRKRKGVDASLVTRVEGELLQTTNAAPVTTPPPAVAAAPGMPAMPGAPAAPALPGVDPVYTELVTLVGKHSPSPQNPDGPITSEYLTGLLSHYGIAEGSLQNAAHNIPAAAEALAWIKQALAQMGLE